MLSACGGGDGASGDGGSDGGTDSAAGDAATGDATPGDATPGDATPGDATPGDATPGDATLGDATPGDATPGDGGACVPIMCQGRVRECGDCLDNSDGDGLIDDRDPDCLGPCDNNEGGFFLNIPGGETPSCSLDCYFDQDQGSGNDKCQWDNRCDPLEPDNRCEFSDPPPAAARCPGTQDAECIDFCAPLTPNGCDCFGCCELPGGSGNFAFLGSQDVDGNPTCDLENALDPAACHPCTPVRPSAGEEGCFNECGRCELCLGRGLEDLPADCFPPPPIPDGGVPDGGFPDGAVPDGGVPDGSVPPPPPACEDGRQSCGVPGASPCMDGYFCLTGCCTFFG